MAAPQGVQGSRADQVQQWVNQHGTAAQRQDPVIQTLIGMVRNLEVQIGNRTTLENRVTQLEGKTKHTCGICPSDWLLCRLGIRPCIKK